MLNIAGIFGQTAAGLASAGAQQAAAQQQGLKAAEQYGVFGAAAQGALASSSADVFQNQSPAALLALSGGDTLSGLGEGFASTLANSVISPFQNTAASTAASIPAVAWIALIILGLYLLGGRHAR